MNGSLKPQNKISDKIQDKMPRAYRDGLADFYGRDFIVTPDVLIPRPETEQLIDEVLSLAGVPYLPGVKKAPSILPKNPKILDVGTGSGCIAITLRLGLKDAEVSACDLSEKALEIARKNAKKFNIEVNFFKSDLLENVDFTPDVIVANLPYVDKNWDWLDKEALSYEPSTALYAKNHGLDLIFKLIDAANSQFLILEADPSEHDEIINYAKSHDYELRNTRGYIISFMKDRGFFVV